MQEYATPVQDDGIIYVARSYGQERIDGTWTGWLEFHPDDPNLPVLQTDQETSQPNRMTVEYWATGLEPIYLEGAFNRAKRNAADRASQASRETDGILCAFTIRLRPVAKIRLMS